MKVAKPEKVIVTLDSSAMDAFNECETKWGLLFKENLRLPDTDTSTMDFGTLIHDLLARYYSIRAINPGQIHLMDANQAFEDFCKSGIIQKYGFDFQENAQFIRKRFGEYAIKYYPSTDFIPKVVNGKAAIEIGFSKVLYRDHLRIYVVEGRIDLLATLQGNDIFWDHKSQEKAKDLYPYSPQFLTYAWATGYKYGGYNYFGLQKEANDKTFRRQLVNFPPHMIEWWKNRMMAIFHKVYNHLKYGVALEMNPSTCAGNYNSWPCMFTRICHEQPDKRELKKWFNFVKVEPWSPWKEEELVEKSS